jgi:hypothetical protein
LHQSGLRQSGLRLVQFCSRSLPQPQLGPPQQTG